MSVLPQCICRPVVRLLITITALLFSAATMFGGTVAEGSTTSAAATTSTGRLTCKPSTLWFGNVTVGQTKTLSFTVTNTGSASVTVSTMNKTAAPGFSVSTLKLPLTLAAGQSVRFNISFTPQIDKHVDGDIAFTSKASNRTLYLYLHGTGVKAGRLTCKPSNLNLGYVTVGHGKRMSVTMTNTGSSSVTVTKKGNAAPGFWLGLKLPLTLAPGHSGHFYAHFSPTMVGAASGHIYLISNASNPKLTITLSGMVVGGNSLAPNPSNIGFGSVQIGKSLTRYETLTNSGTSSVTVSSATISGSGFSRGDLSVPLTLAAGHSVTFSVTFTPKTGDNASGSVSFNSSASNSALKVKLSGHGTASGQLVVSPAAMNFGTVVVGSSKSLTGTLSASGAPVAVSSDSLTSSEFGVSGLKFPLTLAAGHTASFTLTFKPQRSGAATARFSVGSNASNSPAIESLTGTGTAATQHSVSLSWNASTSPIIGYNVYRGSQSGGPYAKINSVLDTSTNYLDMSVQGGHSYYYVTTQWVQMEGRALIRTRFGRPFPPRSEAKSSSRAMPASTGDRGPHAWD